MPATPVAGPTEPPHTSPSVKPAARPLLSTRCALAALLWVHLLAVLVMTASPRIHHWVHPDADDDDHDCAVMLFIHGATGLVPSSMVILACTAIRHVPTRFGVCQTWVAGIFAVNSTLEHAPPPAGHAFKLRQLVVVM